MSSLTPLQQAEVKRVFDMVDTDGSGSLDKQEVAGVLRAVLSKEPSEQQIQQLFETMDTNGDGSVR